MHHADLDIDVSTGLRFHPFEILISLAIKIATIFAFGIPPVAVFVFEVVLNATSLFNHSNVRMPRWLDRALRLIVVTPDMHRVHHSIERPEHDSNFGFNLPWWDRLFRTYRREPAAGHDGMTIGLPQFRDPKELRLDRLLTQPFRTRRGANELKLLALAFVIGCRGTDFPPGIGLGRRLGRARTPHRVVVGFFSLLALLLVGLVLQLHGILVLREEPEWQTPPTLIAVAHISVLMISFTPSATRRM